MTEEEKVTEFLKETFKNTYEIIEPKISPLTKPGENYLSVMLKVDLNLKKNEHSQEETIHAVAKCVRTTSSFAKEIFPVAFKNEINFYKEVIPALQNFQRERGMVDVMDFFPEFYGARINKTGGEEVDDNVVLVLENLKIRGYTNIDRYLGFDLQGAELILKDLAELHATALALKFTKTEVFEDKIKRYCQKAIPPPPPEDRNPYKQSLVVFFEILDEYEDCRPYIQILKEKFLKMREKLNEFFDLPAREPFATLVHCDVWVNNTMQLTENQKLTKNKFVDFQLFFYQSPATDVLFFIWTSVQTEVLKNEFKNLLEYYHNEFTECLRNLNCNTNLFTYDKFLEELNFAAPSNFMDIMYMTLFVVFGKKDLDDSGSAVEENVLKENIPVAARERIAYMVEEYGRRGWI